MARKPSPWWWEAEQGWYVNYQGQRRPLGKHPPGAPKPKKSDKTGKWNTPREIDDAFHALMRGEGPGSLAAARPAERTVFDVLRAFNAWCKENREGLTAKRYKEFLEDFVNFTGEAGQFGLLPVPQLTSAHVTEWLAARGKAGRSEKARPWGPTTRKNAITALQRALNWGVKNYGLARNPIDGMEKPEADRKREIVTPEEVDLLLAHVKDEPFRDLVIVSYDSGCRPQEVKRLEARHLELDKQRAVLPASEAKGKRKARVVYFPTDRSMEIVRRLAARHPDGPPFRNRLGNAWTGLAVKCRFEDLDAVVGRRLTQYMFRRAWITEKLIAGVDSHVVAQLSGHSSTAMIDRHYSAVARDHEFMLRQAAKAVSRGKGSGDGTTT